MKTMPQSHNGPRSKFSRLAHQVRWRVYNLLADGATLKSLLADPEVAAALERAEMKLNGPNLSGIRKSREYSDFMELRKKHLEARQRDMMLTAVVQGVGTLESMTDQARVKLMEVLSDLTGLADLEEESKIKALRSLAQSVAALTNPAKDNQIADLKRKLSDAKRLRDAAESEWKNREAELLAEIDSWKKRVAEILAGSKQKGGLSEDSLREIEERIGLL